MSAAEKGANDAAEELPGFYRLFEVIETPLRVFGIAHAYKRASRGTDARGIAEAVYYAFGIAHTLIIIAGESAYIKSVLDDLRVDDFVHVTELMCTDICCVVSTLKGFSIGWQAKSVFELTEQLRMLYEQPHDDAEVVIIRKFIGRSYKVVRVYSILVTLLIVVFNIFPIIGGVYGVITGQGFYLEFPYFVKYPFNPRSSKTMVALIYMLHVYAGHYVCFGWISFDCLYFIYLTHLSLQLELVIYRLHKVGQHDEKTDLATREMNDEQRFKAAVIGHIAVLKACDMAKGMFAFPLLVNIVSGGLQNCAVMFSILISPPMLMMKFILPFLMSTTQFFLLSFFGDMLKETSGRVADAAYEINWPDLPINTRKTVALIINKGHRFESVTAMGFSNVSMLTFTSIMKVSFSYFTLLKTVYFEMID